MYSTLSRLQGRKENQRALIDAASSPAAGTNRIGGASICRYHDAVVDRIEFDIIHRNETYVGTTDSLRLDAGR